MRIWGLTGSIGMGKSTAAGAFRRLGVPVFDADAAVHALQAKGGRAVRAIERAFPGTVRDGAVLRERLRAAVLGDPAALRRLEAIMHPLVRDEQRRFLGRERGRGTRLVVLDIPLLFETRHDLSEFDRILVVSAPAAVQRARVLARRGMTEERLAAIRARQMPDAEKRRRADVVIRTGLSRRHAEAAVRRLVKTETGGKPRHA
ncbi:dephospho-CoA kinase [Roseococcus sp. SYP-B2431]|uniref:dephospho-CoA kinase n=1 Tax=Roseococcus sp. SYP-B2431 TaxID=2496640 RepID=UPI0010395B30|nr:dephospho-CoA kinase [Roseococcus sp. SYP-B2431]TCH98091.1 dephospho-CoA kinase [Roseococcus sp. SYP-B2431]